jgi:hypothetical protein
MPTRRIIRREARVAFSRRAQPLWFRILKWAILGQDTGECLADIHGSSRVPLTDANTNGGNGAID